jgi:hypothetical protein
MEDCFGERLKACGRTVETPLRGDETARFFGAGRRTLHGLPLLKWRNIALKTPSRSNPAQASLQTCQNCRRNAPIHWILVFSKEVGSQVGSHVCNQALLRCLRDTHLESANMAVDGLPVDGIPLRRFA